MNHCSLFKYRLRNGGNEFVIKPLQKKMDRNIFTRVQQKLGLYWRCPLPFCRHIIRWFLTTVHTDKLFIAEIESPTGKVRLREQRCGSCFMDS